MEGSVAAAALAAYLGVPDVAGATPMSFPVMNGTDSGSGSLRAAIQAVDNDTNDIFATPDTITVTGGPFTVTLNTPLPQITRPVVLDGGGSLTINAATAQPATNDALVLQAGSDESTVSGLKIEGATGGAGIAIVSSLNTIRDNQIGPLSTAPNKFGITVFSSGNTIGGTAASDGNLISGATGSGIFVIGPTGSGPAVSGNVIEGNTIAGNGGPGVQVVSGATANTIGGTSAGAGNAIYGSTGPGVLVSGQGSSGNLIDGNLIGISPDGLGGPQNPGTRIANGEGGITFADSASGNSVTGGTVFAGTAGSAIDAGGGANQVARVSLAGGPDPLITGGQSWNVTGGAPTPTGGGVSIPVTVSGAPPGASVEVDLLDASCTGTAATLPYLAGTTVPIGPGGTGTGTILASTDPSLPVFESSDGDGPLNLADPCRPTGPTGACAGQHGRASRHRGRRAGRHADRQHRHLDQPSELVRLPVAGMQRESSKLPRHPRSDQVDIRGGRLQRRFHDPRRRHGCQRGRVDLRSLGCNGSGDRRRRATNRRAHSDERIHCDRGHQLPQLIHPHMRAVLQLHGESACLPPAPAPAPVACRDRGSLAPGETPRQGRRRREGKGRDPRWPQ